MTAPMERNKTRPPRRNDPCHGGSGRKYKNCHFSIDETGEQRQSPAGRFLDLNTRLARPLVAFAHKQFGDAWRRFEEYFDDPMDVAQLSVPWAIYQYQIEGASIFDRYAAMKSAYLSADERAWQKPQHASSLSVWEVVTVDPGVSVTMRDLLTGEERCVSDTTASKTLVARDTALARVVDIEGLSLFSGLHPQGLPPREAAHVVQMMRAGLSARGNLTAAQLRDNAASSVLIGIWEEIVASLEDQSPLPQALRNTDGDPFLLTTDHFHIAPGMRSTVETQLLSIPGAEPPEPGTEPPTYVFVRRTGSSEQDRNVIVGQATLAGQALTVETNSIQRADALRARIEEACGDAVRHRIREHVDPLSEKSRRAMLSPTRDTRPPEHGQILHELQRRHYTEWLDTPIPALRGNTPRQAVKTKKGRQDVDLLLREFENREQRRPDAPPFDFSWLRRELHLDE